MNGMWARAMAVWLLVMAAEFVHGTLRWIFLRPHVVGFRSGQIGIFTGSVLFLLIVYLCEPRMKLRSTADCLRVGLLWVVLTLAWEWSFGHYGTGRSWESMAAEYDVRHGGLMPVGAGDFSDDAVDGVSVKGKVRKSPMNTGLHPGVAVALP